MELTEDTLDLAQDTKSTSVDLVITATDIIKEAAYKNMGQEDRVMPVTTGKKRQLESTNQSKKARIRTTDIWNVPLWVTSKVNANKGRATRVCLSVKHLRESDFSNLEQWLALESNVYVAGRSTVFIATGLTAREPPGTYVLTKDGSRGLFQKDLANPKKKVLVHALPENNYFNFQRFRLKM